MNFATTFGSLAALVAAALMLEGASVATGGEVYLASVRYLAEAGAETTSHDTTSQETTTTVTVPPPASPPAETTASTAPAAPTDQTIAPQPPPPPPPTTTTTEPPPTTEQHTQPPPLPPPPPPPPFPPPPQQQGQPFGSQQPGPEHGQGGPGQFPPQGFPFPEEGGHGDQEFVDPRELQQVLREIRDLRSQIKQVVNQARRNPAFADDLAKLNATAAELAQFDSGIRSGAASGGSVRELVQEFRDNQYWDQMNAIRAKVQMPNEIKQIKTTIRRLERSLSVKSIQGIGLDIAKVQGLLGEMKQQVAQAESQLAAGNYEEAQEAMQFFHEGGHPGEIEGTIYRVRDIKTMLRRVKDAQIRAEVDKVLQEVIDAFNAGEYRDARETMDEYADDLQRLIQRFVQVRSFQGKSRADSFSKIRNLDELIRAKLQEPDQQR